MPRRTILRRTKWIRRYALYFLLRAFYWCVRRAPHSVLRVLICVGSAVLYRLAHAARRQMRHSLALAFPERSRASRERIAERVFLNLGRAAVDALAVQRSSVASHRPVVVKADWDCVRERFFGQGSVSLTGHIGAWELLAGLIAQLGPGKIGVVAKRIYFPPFNRMIAGFREAFGCRIFYQRESFRPAIRYLRQNASIGILPDQDLKRLPGIFVPFFGRPAWTATGPAVLALAARVPITCAYLVWEKDHYRLTAEAPLQPPNSGSRETDIRILTEQWSASLERMIRRYPDQWVWFHRRWRTQPGNLKPG